MRGHHISAEMDWFERPGDFTAGVVTAVQKKAAGAVPAAY
jgi:hypothetical protein